MKKWLVSMFLVWVMLPANAQVNLDLQRWSIEPSISITGFIEAGVSNAIYYEATPRFRMIAYTSVITEVIPLYKGVWGADQIKTDHNYTLSQKIGGGYKWYGKRRMHTVGIIGGLHYENFKGSYESPDGNTISSGGKSLKGAYGLFYARNRLTTHQRSMGFRLYVPIKPYSLNDNIVRVTLDFGINFKR